MERRTSHRKHEDVLTIVREALSGHSFVVNRAFNNGDLAQLPESLQRTIVATANEIAADFAESRIVPLTEENIEVHKNYVVKKRTLALRIMFGFEGKTISDELTETDED